MPGIPPLGERGRPGSDAGGLTGVIPVVTHTYDYSTPRNSPARFAGLKLNGPWLYTAFKDKAIPDARWLAVARYLNDRLGDRIQPLASGSDPLPNFHVVETRGTLTPAKLGDTGESGNWMNEIHPNFRGYEKLAKRLDSAVLDLLS